MKLHCLLLALWSLSVRGVYISRMSTIRRAPTVFRPGVSLQSIQQRPFANHPRLMQAASHRAPYVLYRNPSTHRYGQMKPYSQNTRSVYNLPSLNNSPWKTTARLPASKEYESLRMASLLRAQNNGVKTVKGRKEKHSKSSVQIKSPKFIKKGLCAIHTIPAPNLSLSEKPIVVLDSQNLMSDGSVPITSEAPKTTYEVTEKYMDPINYHLGTKMVKTEPIGFTKGSLSTQDLYMRNGAALQLASDLGLPAIAMPQHSQIPFLQPQPVVQTFPEVHHPQQFMQQGLDGIIIQPNVLYQPDPAFLQKIQNQLLQRFPSVEFVPYNAGDLQPQLSTQSQIYLVANNGENQVNHIHNLNKLVQQRPPQHQQLSIIPLENEAHKNVVRETQEGNAVTLAPQLVANVTEHQVEVISVTQPQSVQNVTYAIIEADTQPATTTVRYVLETSTEEQKTTPIYYAQVGQSVGNVEANGFYTAINDVRAAAALAQMEKAAEQAIKKEETTTSSTTTTSTSTINPDIQKYFVQSVDKNEQNETVNELKSLLGVPFTKSDSVKGAYTLLRADDKDTKVSKDSSDSVKVAYTLLRTDDKNTKVSKDGSVYAGQLVEATISEDQDFNKEKADLLSRRPPIRLFTVRDLKEVTESQTSTTTTTPKITVVKAKIPPRSKLTFDDKTGEPVLRIYASYIDTPLQKDMIASKLASVKRVNEVVARKQDSSALGDWKSATVKGLDMGSDISKVTQFGLKLKSRMDDIVPIFDDYED